MNVSGLMMVTLWPASLPSAASVRNLPALKRVPARAASTSAVRKPALCRLAA